MRQHDGWTGCIATRAGVAFVLTQLWVFNTRIATRSLQSQDRHNRELLSVASLVSLSSASVQTSEPVVMVTNVLGKQINPTTSSSLVSTYTLP
jgi:hypothetical protein